MSTYTTPRRVQLESLGFEATVRSQDGISTYEANQTPAALQAAVDAAPLNERDANITAIRDKARQALAANDTFLALSNPNNAQTLAQVQRLTRECSALIRLVIGAVDTTDGT
jgi:hypothetical protein